jgi:hypothetical protein
MDNLFLARPIGSAEIGSQIFTRALGLEANYFINTLFSSSSSSSSSSSVFEPPGLLNSVLIQNAGLNQLNGIYIYQSEFENKPLYAQEDNPDLFIFWFENQWEIYDFNLDFNPIYIGIQDVPYPWNISVWLSANPIYEPVPIVTKVL